MKNFFSFRKKVKDQEVLNLIEVFNELKNTADKICEKIENKITELKEIEKRVDDKMEEYKRFVYKLENNISHKKYDKKNDVIMLYRAGESAEKISKILNVPLGEVELLINLYKIKSQEK